MPRTGWPAPAHPGRSRRRRKGNGGRRCPGDIVLEVSTQVHTLLDFHFRPHLKATNGKPGAGDERNGADGDELVLLDGNRQEIARFTRTGSKA